MVDAPDIRPANGGGLHPQQHLAVARLGNGHFPQYGRAVAGQEGPLHCSGHCAISPFGSHRSSQLWSCLHRNTWPLIRRQFLSMPAIAAHLLVREWVADDAAQVGTIVVALCREWDRCLPPLHAPFDAHSGGVEAVPLRDADDDRVLDVDRVLGGTVPLGASRRTYRRVADGLDPVGADEFEQLGLLEVRVQLHLVDGRLEPGVAEHAGSVWERSCSRSRRGGRDRGRRVPPSCATWP